MSAQLDRARKLVALACSGEGEEQRSAALIAVRYIAEHGLLGRAAEPMRSHAELRPVIRLVMEHLFERLWEGRRHGLSISATAMVDEAIQAGGLRPTERERGIAMVSALAARMVRDGLLEGVRGRTGGYRLGAGVRRRRAIPAS